MTHRWAELLLRWKSSLTPGMSRKRKNPIKKKEGGRGVLVLGVGGVQQFLLCYWEMASSSCEGFKSTTVVPLREAPPSADDESWQFLLAAEKHQNSVRTRTRESSVTPPVLGFNDAAGSVTLTCWGGRRQSQNVGSAPSSSVGLGADVGVACCSFLLVVVAMELVLHQEDEDEDQHRGHYDPTDDDDHGAAQELEENQKETHVVRHRECVLVRMATWSQAGGKLNMSGGPGGLENISAALSGWTIWSFSLLYWLNAWTGCHIQEVGQPLVWLSWTADAFGTCWT